MMDEQAAADEFDELSASVEGVGSLHLNEIAAEIRSLDKSAQGRFKVVKHETKVKLMILAHSGLSGHSGIERTYQRLRELFTWPRMREDIDAFVKRCLHCLACKDAQVKSLLASQLHAQERNRILHYDFLYIKEKEYLLVIKDDFSHFVELVICESASHYEVVDALLGWNSRYGLLPRSIHISDRGSHFKNQVVQELQRCLKITHRFTPAHSPQSNGTVEIVNRHILKSLRTLKSEFKTEDWKSLVSLIQASLNLNRSPSLGGLSRTEVFFRIQEH